MSQDLPQGTVMEESDLILASKNGDLDSFNLLVESYQTRVYNLALRMLGNRQAAEDATQEAFLFAFKGIAKFRGGSFRTWLFRIVASSQVNLETAFERGNLASSTYPQFIREANEENNAHVARIFGSIRAMWSGGMPSSMKRRWSICWAMWKQSTTCAASAAMSPMANSPTSAPSAALPGMHSSASASQNQRRISAQNVILF
jgi:RNA polymerase sigma factor (sigma-70 family)